MLYPDRDRDKAPDDFEGRHEYDAGDAADGASDDDGDGLAMWRESRLGTDPRKADSDGDGIGDGQELQDATDPTDPASFVSRRPSRPRSRSRRPRRASSATPCSARRACS
ncbi:MAG: hypothetical protein U1F43_06480 [Myxococcota bacterium]